MEVYGTKPKRFTKEWWEYFWDYYKIHTITFIIVLFFIISTINECSHRVNYDLQIDYISENTITEDYENALTALIEENIDDITGNGKSEAHITLLDMGEHGDPQYTQAMYTKYTIEMGYTESFVFIVSEKYANELGESGIFEPSENWTDIPSYNGYFISLENCTKLQEIGINTDDLYVAVMKIRERDKKAVREKNRLIQENGIKFAKFLINAR